MSNPETALKAAVIEAVNATGLAVVWTSPSGGIRKGGAYIKLAPKGTPDIIGHMGDGRLVGLEVKVAGGKTDKIRAQLQHAWRMRAADAGCVVGEVRSALEAVELVTRQAAVARPRDVMRRL